MATFELEPSDGPHAASGLTDQELEFLQHVVTVELAIRLDKEVYERRFSGIAEHREDMDEMVTDWRNQRDRMVFVASVIADLDQLPIRSES